MQVMAEQTHGPVVLRAVACRCDAEVCQTAFTVAGWAHGDETAWITVGVTGLYSEATLDEFLETLRAGEALDALHKVCAVIGQPWEELTATNRDLQGALWRFTQMDPELIAALPAEQCWAARESIVGSDPWRVYRALYLVASSYTDEQPVAREDLR